MNKLYKYLPFDVDFTSDFTTYKLTYGLMERIESGEIEGLPILRPFEDLTKELPLTKAAAEMIGRYESEFKKEGELVNCFNLLFSYFLDDCAEYIEEGELQVPTELYISDNHIGFQVNGGTSGGSLHNWNDAEKPDYTKVQGLHRSDYSFWSLEINNKHNWFPCEYYWTMNGYVEWLDFLRAMKFAVDFKEDEYIKYETH